MPSVPRSFLEWDGREGGKAIGVVERWGLEVSGCCGRGAGAGTGED